MNLRRGHGVRLISQVAKVQHWTTLTHCEASRFGRKGPGESIAEEVEQHSNELALEYLGWSRTMKTLYVGIVSNCLSTAVRDSCPDTAFCSSISIQQGAIGDPNRRVTQLWGPNPAAGAIQTPRHHCVIRSWLPLCAGHDLGDSARSWKGGPLPKPLIHCAKPELGRFRVMIGGF